MWQVLENGFGLGLNLLATWQAWRSDPRRPARLFYSAVEAHPPEAADLLRSAAPYPELHPLASSWPRTQVAALLLPGLHHIELAGGALQLTLAVGDARAVLAELTGRFDSVFLDGFDPQRTPPCGRPTCCAPSPACAAPARALPPGAWPARCASGTAPAASR